MFSWRNTKDISIFRMKKAPYLLLCFADKSLFLIRIALLSGVLYDLIETQEIFISKIAVTLDEMPFLSNKNFLLYFSTKPWVLTRRVLQKNTQCTFSWRKKEYFSSGDINILAGALPWE